MAKTPRKKFTFLARNTVPLSDDLVYRCAQTMLPVESIATILDCPPHVLHEKYQRALNRGREERKQSLVEAMWHKALVERDTKMMIWLSKQHLGYKENMPEQPTSIQFNVTCNEVPKESNTIDLVVEDAEES